MTRAELETLNIVSRRGLYCLYELGHEPRDPGLPWRFAQGVGGGGGAHASPPAPRSTRQLQLSDRRRGRAFLSRQEARTHQEFVDSASALPALADRPDDERLAAPHVAGGEQLRNRGAVVDGIGADITAGIELDTGLLDHAGLARPKKAHCQEDEISLQIEGAARDLLHHKAAVWALRPVDPNAIESCHPSVLPDSTFGQHRPVALAALFLR